MLSTVRSDIQATVMVSFEWIIEFGMKITQVLNFFSPPVFNTTPLKFTFAYEWSGVTVEGFITSLWCCVETDVMAYLVNEGVLVQTAAQWIYWRLVKARLSNPSVAISMFTSVTRTKNLSRVVLSSFSMNLLAFYHECRPFIDYPTLLTSYSVLV